MLLCLQDGQSGRAEHDHEPDPLHHQGPQLQAGGSAGDSAGQSGAALPWYVEPLTPFTDSGLCSVLFSEPALNVLFFFFSPFREIGFQESPGIISSGNNNFVVFFCFLTKA